MTDEEIIKAVKGFVKGLLKERPTTDMCYMVCSPLASYLSACGTECTLTEGELNGLYHHFWITLADGRIIDPTADQFGLLNIYVRKPPSYYKQYTAKDFDDKIKKAVRKFENQQK
jgi:hypothetical protein